jgi:hypothetical protein
VQVDAEMTLKIRRPSTCRPSPIFEALVLTRVFDAVTPGPDPLWGLGSARLRMLRRPASLVPRLGVFLPPPWRRVGTGRAGVRGRGYVCGASRVRGTADTGGGGSTYAMGAGLFQVSNGSTGLAMYAFEVWVCYACCEIRLFVCTRMMRSYCCCWLNRIHGLPWHVDHVDHDHEKGR